MIATRGGRSLSALPARMQASFVHISFAGHQYPMLLKECWRCSMTLEFPFSLIVLDLSEARESHRQETARNLMVVVGVPFQQNNNQVVHFGGWMVGSNRKANLDLVCPHHPTFPSTCRTSFLSLGPIIFLHF